MKKRKAQVTILIILAIAIAAIIGIFLLIRSSNIISQNAEYGNIYSFTENCIQQTATEIIYDIGERGGYYFAPGKTTSSGIPYYNSQIPPPSNNIIEDEISSYTERKLAFCTKNFLNFEDLNIKEEEIDVTTSIRDNEIIINTEYPLEITKEESTTYLKDFNNIVIPLRLGTMKKAADEIAANQKDTQGICLDCLIETTEKYDVYIDMTDFEEGTIIIIKDKQSIIDEELFKFIFTTEVDAE